MDSRRSVGNDMKKVASRGALRYEHSSQPVLELPQFIRRIFAHVGIAAGLVAASLAIGVAGYHFLAGLSWIDAFVNASMILGGMGPVAEIPGEPGKIFAALYALYSGIAFLAVSAVLIAPFAHRLLHRLHLDEPVSDD